MPTTPSEPARTASIRLTVTGMHCSSCPALIEEAIADHAGVAFVSADLHAAEAHVVFDPSIVSIDDLCAVIADAGYRATVHEDPSCP
jgi:copper chaperone CopZ